MPDYRIIAGPEWTRVIAALARADEELPHKFRDEIKKEAEDYAEIARNRVRSLPTPSNAGHTGLRERVAAGVHVVESGAAGVRVVTSMAKQDEAIIPRGLDRLAGWRHPLFGNKAHWFRNPGYGWFMSTFSNSKDDFENKLEKVLEAAANNIAEAGGIIHT